MKLFSSILAAVLLVASTAFAYDNMVVTQVASPGETITRTVSIPSGHVVVEVFAGVGSPVSCKLAVATGESTPDQSNTKRCIFEKIEKNDTVAQVRITNLGAKPTDFKVHVHTSR